MTKSVSVSACGNLPTFCSIRKGLLSKLALLVASLSLCYFLFELVLFPMVLPYLPKRLVGYLPEPLMIGFTFKTKRGLLPKHYTAILGDSYALGLGDELNRIKGWENNGFGSAARLFKKTQGDFFVIARAGNGSLDSLVKQPIALFRYLHGTFSYRLQEPERVLVYFFEGNDLDDDLEELRERFEATYDENRLRDEKYFRRFIEEKMLPKSSFENRTDSFGWCNRLFFARTFLKMVRSFVQPKATDKNSRSKQKPGDVNRIFIHSEETAVPDHLQSPALELSEAEIDTAVNVFGQSLRYSRRYFPKAKFFIVYIPSPLASYELASKRVTIQTYHGRGDTYDAALVERRSNLISDKIEEETRRAGGIFIDTRDAVKRAAAKRLIHGPLDWKHFNEYGYDALSEAIKPYLN